MDKGRMARQPGMQRGAEGTGVVGKGQSQLESPMSAVCGTREWRECFACDIILRAKEVAMNSANSFVLFGGFWFALMIGLWIYAYRAGVATKQRWHTVLTILPGVVFFGFACVVAKSTRELLMIAPAVSVITYLHLKFSKLCERCGRVVRQHFPRARFCTGCGAPIS
jgi:hypothetical protein